MGASILVEIGGYLMEKAYDWPQTHTDDVFLIQPVCVCPRGSVANIFFKNVNGYKI